MASDDGYCERCSRILHTGQAMVLVGFTAEELAGIATDTRSEETRDRVLGALALVDHGLASELRAAMASDAVAVDDLDEAET